MVEVRRAYVYCRFGQLHVRVAQPAEGAGRVPVMCFHSSPNSGRLYETLLNQLGEDRLCLAPDTPGFGYSDPPPSLPSIDDYAGAMADLAEALELRQVDLIGYHTGSEISIALALRLPSRVRRLVLISAPIFTDQELSDHRAHYAKRPLSRDGTHVSEKWRGHLRWAGPGVSKEHVAAQFSDPMRRPDISWWGHNAAFDYPTAERLTTVTQPVMVLNPDDDLYEQTLRAEGTMGRGFIKELPEWGHGFMEIHTTEATKILKDFLDEDSP